MGCGSSVVTQGNMPHLCGLKLECDMTYEQKYLIRETWKFLEVSKKEIGVSVYKRFFSMYPNLKDHFGEFKNIKIDEIDGSQSHFRRVLTAMDNCVAALGDSVSFSAYVEELGRRHNRRSLMHLNAFRSCFISVVHEILAMAYLWDPEVEQAWNRLFDYITILMLRGIQLAEE